MVSDGGNAGSAAGGNGTASARNLAAAAAKNARRALAIKVRDNEMKLTRLRRKAIALAEDLGDPDVLAEILEECQ